MDMENNSKINIKINNSLEQNEIINMQKSECVRIINKTKLNDDKNRIYKYKSVAHFNFEINYLMTIIFLFFINVLKECSQEKINVYSSIITITINQSGLQNIFNGEDSCFRDKFDIPDEVVINNVKKDIILYQYDFEGINNIIQLKWNDARENWGCLFKDCEAISEIDFSQFDFSQSIRGNMMFRNCRALTSLNINDFGKVKIKDAGSFFQDLISLTSLNLSNFDMSEVTDIGWMFLGCTSLVSLDLSNFHTDNINVPVEYTFWSCPKLEYINLKNAYFAPGEDPPLISAKKNVVFCNYDQRIISKVEGYECAVIDCSENWRQNQNKINLENEECVADCSLTNNNKYNYKSECHVECPIGTYNNNYQCEECHPDCKTCEKGAEIYSTNCKSCSDIDKYLNFGNCYYKEENINNDIVINDLTDFNNIMDNFLELFIPENGNGNGLIIKRPDNIVHHITDSKNELELLKNMSNNINNISIIDLYQCESILKNEYHLNEEDSLIIIKREIFSIYSSEKNVSFDVYEPYNKTKLNLSFCDDTPVDVYIPIELSKDTRQLYEQMKESGYDMFNINDPFYQDICTPFDSLNGTDILLSDRINYIYHNDDTQCQSNCQFSNYSIESQYLKCSCSTNINIKYDKSKTDKFNTKKLYESFYDVLKYSNYDILKCYKIITDINKLKCNIGSIIAIIFFCNYLIYLFIYICKGINPLKMQLKIELKNSGGKNNFLINSNLNNLLYSPIKKKLTTIKKLKANKVQNYKIRHKKNLNSFRNNSNRLQIYSNSGSKKNVLNVPEFNKLNSSKIKKQNTNNKSEIENIKKIKYSDYELNELEFEKAIKLDNRTLFQIYCGTLKREHLLIFTFCNCNDYNLQSIKLTRFIFLIVGDMALNTFFFSDDSMHKLFLNYGKYNFIQQIPQITYSTIISSVIEIFLCYLSLTDKYFYLIKSNFIKGEKNNMIKTIKCVKIKLIFFYIFIFIFFILYWYIITIFCGVYRNTQIAFIKDSAISFSIGLIYPIFLYFLSASLRYCSLTNKKKSCKCIYNLSYMIPFF